MFDIKKLCSVCTLKSSNYSFTYDKELKIILSFKSGGKLTYDELKIENYILKNPDRYTNPFSFKQREFTDIKTRFFLKYKVPIRQFNTRKSFVDFLVKENFYDKWIMHFESEISSAVRKYIELYEIDEISADTSDYERIEDKISLFISSNYDSILKDSCVYVFDNLVDQSPFTFAFLKDDNQLAIKINFSESSIGVKEYFELNDDSFINSYLLDSITSWVTIRIDLKEELVFDPNSYNSSVSFAYNSRGKTLNNDMPKTASVFLSTIFDTVNTALNDENIAAYLRSAHQLNLVNLSIKYSDKEKPSAPGELEIMAGLMLYDYNMSYLDKINRSFTNKKKTVYEFMLNAYKNPKFIDSDGNYIVEAIIKNRDTNTITKLIPKDNSTNSLEELGFQLIEYFKENGKPKKFILNYFYDYIYLAHILGDWNIKADYEELDLDVEEEAEEDDDYIKA